MTTTIYIPTFRRLGQQETWKWLSPYWRDRAWLVAPEEEADTLEMLGYRVLVTPVEGNLGNKRQWILDQHDVERYGETVILADDDIRFALRRPDEPTKFRKLNGPNEFDDMMALVEDMMQHVAFGGIADRGGANRELAPYRLNARVNGLLILNVRVARENNIKVNRNLCMDDFDLGLQFLTEGYPSLTLNSYVKDYAGGSNAPGGCSTYRTKQNQEDSARLLKQTFPDFVTLTERDSGWRGEMAGTRLDVRVAWSRAYRAGQAWRDMLGVPREPDFDWSLGTLEKVSS